MILFGALLLLPGLCGSFFVQARLSNPLATSGLVASGIGIAMMIAGLVWLILSILAKAMRR
jgi:hypothetical protein